MNDDRAHRRDSKLNGYDYSDTGAMPPDVWHRAKHMPIPGPGPIIDGPLPPERPASPNRTPPAMSEKNPSLPEKLRNWWFHEPQYITYSSPVKTVWGKIDRWIDAHFVFTLVVVFIASALATPAGQTIAFLAFFALKAMAGRAEARASR